MRSKSSGGRLPRFLIRRAGGNIIGRSGDAGGDSKSELISLGVRPVRLKKKI